ncbi:MAG: ATPase inhibitor subunit zeta, partial [Rhodospirillaceae bacterium]
MNDAFQDREKGFERKYQLDQEQQFRAQSRRDR